MRVFGHRGNRHHARPDLYPNAPFENSLAAFNDALNNSDGLETDLVTTAQGGCFLAHDTLFADRVHYELAGKLDRNGQDKLAGRRMDELDNAAASALTLRDGTALPSLEALCRLAQTTPDKTINLELKGPRALDGFVRFRQEHAPLLTNPVIVSSFNWPALARARAVLGGAYKLGVLFAMEWQDEAPMFPGWPGAPQDAAYIPLDGPGRLHDPLLADIAPDFFCLEHKTATPAALDAIARAYPGAGVILWGYAEPHPDEDASLIHRLKTLPPGMVNAVITDFPAAWRYHLTLNDYPLE